MSLTSSLLKKIFGSRNERVVRRLSKYVTHINALEPVYEKLSDAELRAKTDEFRVRLQKGETLDDLLVEAFAVIREASKRTIRLRHFDVQLIGGIVLHQGKIAEMSTGEGKTLVATMPAYLNALAGQGMHIVTVNDYLAKRDAEWMGPIYQFLGLTVGVNTHDLTREAKQAAYRCDITYGTNNEFGFDYLRDNMVYSLDQKVQRSLKYAIVDEVDSILIDEARTPLIISGPTDDNSDVYLKVDRLIPRLTKREKEGEPGDFFLDEKQKQAFLTEEGHAHVEELMYKEGLIQPDESLYDPSNIALMHHVYAALRAHKLYHRDVEYIVQNGEVVIVDEHTGRTMPGRRWSDSLHQAIEAKEKVKIQNENQTLATITFQNYFRIYEKLAGMTGTADTEAYELQQIYNLEVIVIPTNMPMIRKDHPDKVYLTHKEKFKAVVEEINDCRLRRQPVLVGTASVETSEYLSNLLTQAQIPHQVLNAKQHAREAKIIAQAGSPATITIATNMAGRGTDIVLGGNVEVEIAELENPTPEQIALLREDWQRRHNEVVAAGGLHVLGSERHESRRIDNQLRGRSGRQGDPGSSRFYVSLEDNLMRIFAADRISSLMKRLGMKEHESIEHSWLTRSIENAQRKVETFHFDVRKQLLQFDNVANDQRKVIYQQRAELMQSQDVSHAITAIREDVVSRLATRFIPPDSLEEEWDVAGLEQQLISDFNVSVDLKKFLEEGISRGNQDVTKLILDRLCHEYHEKEKMIGESAMRQFERTVMLQVLDQHWKEHLATMDHLRQSIHLMGYAQKDPKQEYKRQAFVLFTNILENIKFEVTQILTKVHVATPEEVAAIEERRQKQAMKQTISYQHQSPQEFSDTDVAAEQEAPEDSDAASDTVSTVRREMPKVGRNQPCPCGSGKKYKQCCGKL
jgi:preprotein translocase subunit SecA